MLGARNEVSLVTNHEFSTCTISCEGNTIYWTKIPQVLPYYLQGKSSQALHQAFPNVFFTSLFQMHTLNFKSGP
jgi:hypothetical protein